MRSRHRLPLATALVAALALTLVAAEAGPTTGGPPTDFIAAADTLSQPDYPQVTTEELHVVMPHDGTDIYVEITRPDPAVYGDGPWPVVMEASPYHGTIATRIGDRIFPDPKGQFNKNLGLTGYFAPRGYAVAMVDLRGTGRSGGCLDHLGPKDALDLEAIVEWAASQSWSNGRVGMTGHSYVGSTPSVAAAQRPDGLVTIAPSAGLASMYDHQFLAGVPWNLQYIGPMVAYEGLALDRHLPPGTPSALGDQTGDDFGNHPTDTGCGMLQSAALAGSGQVTGQYELWHAQRDWRELAREADIPVFMIHGVNDNAARIPAAAWFFEERFMRPGDKVWIGQWDHGSTNGRCGTPTRSRVSHPNCRFDQWQYALHAWFDFHLKGMDVDTGPAVEVFLNGDTALPLAASTTSTTNTVRDPETDDWGRTVYTDTAWRHPAERLELHADASTNSLSFTEPTTTGSRTFRSAANAVLAHSSGSVEFKSPGVAEDLLLLGTMRMQLTASVTNSQVVHLVASLYRESAPGLRQEIGNCAIQPSLRNGVETLSPVVPGQPMIMDLECYTIAHRVPKGQSLVLRIATQERQFATFGSEAQVTVYTGPDHTTAYLPVVPNPVLYPDVPLRAG